ncbi:hypothetical protein ACFQZ4_49630 [Catellatospora coxensis]
MSTSTEPGSPAAIAPLPGGVGVSQLRVYDTTAPDGLVGGTRTCICAAPRGTWCRPVPARSRR